VRPVEVVIEPLVLDHDVRLDEGVKELDAGSSSRVREPNDST